MSVFKKTKQILSVAAATQKGVTNTMDAKTLEKMLDLHKEGVMFFIKPRIKIDGTFEGYEIDMFDINSTDNIFGFSPTLEGAFLLGAEKFKDKLPKDKYKEK